MRVFQSVYVSLKMRRENSKMRLIKKRFLLQILRARSLQNWKRYKLSIQKNDELMRVRDELLSAHKAVIEKDSLLQETNTLLLEQISKTFSEFKQNEVIGGDKGLEKGNEITSPEITSESPFSLFFQHTIIFIIV